MTKLDWFDEAAEALVAAAKLPHFPGDESPAKEYLEKFLNRAFSECHNGGEVGFDECPVCRAFRTEKVEGALEIVKDELTQTLEEYGQVKQQFENFQQEAYAVQDMLDVSEAKAAENEERLATTVNALTKANASVAALTDTIKAKVTELTSLQRINIDLTEKVRELDEKLKRVKEAAEKVLEA